MTRDPFPYMRWAKAHLNGAWGASNLGMSGAPPPLAAEREEWGLPAPHENGAPLRDLKAALAERHGMSPDGVHITAGTSHGNFVVSLALARGGHIVVEEPAYEALPRVAQAIGATCAALQRDARRGWRLDPEDLAGSVSEATSLILVTDLHNPTGARLAEEDLDLLTAAAERVDAHVLVDEVYREFDPQQRDTAASRHPRILTTNSLTKVHGLGELRCGWILGAPEVISRIAAWDDLVHPEQPAASLLAALAYLPQAAERAAALRLRAEGCIAQVSAWVTTTPGVTWTEPHGGLTGFLRLGSEEAPLSADAVASRLLEKHGVRAVPGSFFQRPDWLRISYLLPEAELASALAALADVVAESQP